MQKEIRLIVLLFLPVVIAICMVAKGDCGSFSQPQADEQKPEMLCPKEEFYQVKDKGRNKKLKICYQSNSSQNGDIFVYLHDGKNEKLVLSTQGRSVNFNPNKEGFPDVTAYWHFSMEDNPETVYVWNGHSYEHRDTKAAKALSKRALKSFRDGKSEDAIKLWEEALGLETGTFSAEDYNNLGFAYYTLAKKIHSVQLYNKAEEYIKSALQVNPKRCVAHLNMADLYAEQSEFIGAIDHYKKVLELNPDYKHAGYIEEKISKLRLEPRVVGVEVVALRHPSGEKNITYTRQDEHNVIQRGYNEDGSKRFEEHLKDGKANGPYVSWFENGKVAVKGHNRMGKAIGKWEYFNEDGKLTQVLKHNVDGSLTDATNQQ